MRTIPNMKPRPRLNGLALGILATIVWMLLAGFAVQHRHDIPSRSAYKSEQAHVLACTGTDVRGINRCLDGNYDILLGEWRTETGVAVVMPPMLGWIAALLGSLAGGFGLFRRHQRV